MRRGLILCIHTATQHSDEFMTKNPTHAISVTAPYFLLPSAQSQLKAAAVHQTSPLLPDCATQGEE